MKIKKESILVATLILVLFTALPLASRVLIPPTFLSALSEGGGTNLTDLLTEISAIGLAMSILVLLNGSFGKASVAGLALSVTWKVFWLTPVLFALGLGRIEDLGLAVLSFEVDGALNTVTFDLRLFAVLAVIIVAMKIVCSVLEFQELHEPVPSLNRIMDRTSGIFPPEEERSRYSLQHQKK
jgi:hypothetical protein